MDDHVRRRRLLASLGTASMAALAGCTNLWSRAESPAPEPISLEIKTVPADDDLVAAQLSNRFADNLRTAGVDADQSAIDEPELRREVLMERDFDIAIIKHGGLNDPDALYPLLHSDFVGEPGWQNPFSISDPTIDDHLETQRRGSESDRETTLDDLFDYLIEESTIPYTVAAYHDHLGAVDSALELETVPRSPREYLNALYTAPDSDAAANPLRIGLFGQQSVTRLNPIVIDLADLGPILDLLYDSLVCRGDEGLEPWLADSIEWSTRGDSVEALVTLPEAATWHDGEALTAADVEFTADFLADTSLGDAENPIVAPRYRGRQTLIDDVRVDGTDAARVTFDTRSKAVAKRALTVPLLPEHVWEPRSEVLTDQQTEALATDNEEPIGSGLFQFAEPDTDGPIALEAFEEHPRWDAETAELEDSEETEMDMDTENGGSSDRPLRFDGLEFETWPNPGAAIDALEAGEVNVIANEIPIEEFQTLEDRSGVSSVTRESPSFYMIGYNLRHPALANRRFRGVVSKLLDRETVVTEFFDGHASVPETQTGFAGVPDSNWSGETRATQKEFPGSDGEIDPDRARQLFEEAGYSYADDELVE